MVWNFFNFGGDQSGVASPRHNEVAADGALLEKTVEEALECDYERDCTPLYKAIENAVEADEYEPIIKFLDTGYWPGSFFADSTPPADQARTWVTRFDKEDPNKVKWSQLPLHLAIVCNAPAAIIGRLVKLYPQALRCTDDQHMLPLHLALRHGADDEVIAFLLIRFPDAVNAKGKNGRSAVDCAMRAKSKLRGKILEIFVEKTKDKSASSTVKENKILKAELEKKKIEIDSLKAEADAYRNDSEAQKTMKHSIEADLLMKIQELEQANSEVEAECRDKIERLHSQKLLQELELQKKLDELARSKKEFKEAERKAIEEQASLRKELEKVQELISSSVSPEDWSRLKTEVESLQAYRLKNTKSETRNKIETLKGELEATMALTRKSETRNTELKSQMESELTQLKTNIKKLEASETTAKTSKELFALRNEVDELKKELQDRSEASRTKLELVVLKKAMETELRNAEGKTKEEMMALKKAVVAANTEQLQNKTVAELNAVKVELERLKFQLQERELAVKTKRGLESLRESLEDKIATADPKSRLEFETMKKKVSSLVKQLKGVKSHEGYVAVKQELEELQDELKKKETTSQIVSEAESLNKSLKEELKQSEGQNQEELLNLKESVRGLSERVLSKKDVHELVTIKSELSVAKEKLKAVEKAKKTQQQLDDLKQSLAQELQKTANRTEAELQSMKKAVDAINLEQQARMSLKESLEQEIKAASSQTHAELLEMKKTLDNINLQQVEFKNKAEWEKLQNEMESLKAELNQKKTIHAIKTDKDLYDIRQVVEEMTNAQLQSKGIEQFGDLKKEMEQIKADLKVKEEGEAALKQEIETLKEDGKRRQKGYFFKGFNSWKHPKLEAVTSTDSDGRILHTNTGEMVTTFRPPSLAQGRRGRYNVGRNITSKSSSSSESSNDDGPLAEKLNQSAPKPLLPTRSKSSSKDVTPSVSNSTSKDLISTTSVVVETVHATNSEMTSGSKGVVVETATSQSSRASKAIDRMESIRANNSIQKTSSVGLAPSFDHLTHVTDTTNAATHVTETTNEDAKQEKRDEPPSAAPLESKSTSNTSKKSGFGFKRSNSNPPKPSIVRKVKSMGTSVGSSPSTEQIVTSGSKTSIGRSGSRTVEQASGDVEVEVSNV